MIFMNYKFLLNGIINIILNPVKAWDSIDSENNTVKVVRNNYLLPLISLVSLAAFTGSLVFINTEQSPVFSLFVGLKCFGLLYFTAYASSYVFKEITYPLDLGRDFKSSFKIVVYSLTPFLICQVLSRIFESLLFVNVIGLYGLYIYWTGIEKILNPPNYKKIPMLIATIVTLVGIFIVTNFLLNMLVDKLYFSFFA
jgi:hypothetical protein